MHDLKSRFIPPRTASLRQRVCQLMVLHVSRDLPPGREDLAAFFEANPVGGIFAGGEVIEDGSNRFEHVRETVDACQQASPYPLLVSADLENGGGDIIPGLTPLPFPMALGAANDPELAREYGRVCAQEGQLAGINWALAPMADLNLHPLSSNVGTRAFGDRAQRVLPLLSAFVEGMQAEGMAACAKTFPGDGSDYRDQHLVTTENRLSAEDWQASYGRIFQDLANQGVASVMTGHLALPALQAETSNGFAPPCTLSHELTTGLLKKQMAFHGVVVTDAWGMGGVRNRSDLPEAAVQAFAAGHDMFLWPGLDTVDAIVDALEQGRIPMDRLDDALSRIEAMKSQTRLCPAPNDPATVLREGEGLARRTADASLTLLWDRAPLLPLRSQDTPSILMVGTTAHDKAFQRMETLAERLRDRGFAVELQRHLTPDELAARVPDVDRILFCVERQFHRPLGPMDLSGEEARNLWAACMAGREKTIAVGFGSPYLVPWYFDSAAVAINAYSVVPATLDAVAAAVCGEQGFPGSDPVVWRGRHSETRLV